MASTEPQQIIASEITIVDREGKPRMRLGVDQDGTAAVKFYNKAEELRMALYLKQPPDDSEEDLFFGDYAELGLFMMERHSGVIRLGICEDGLLGRRPHLEVVQGAGTTRRFHAFPPRPPNASD